MGGSAPKPDRNMGLAALKSAETGERMLAWMQEQARVTNAWADEDRSRYKTVFEPLQDRFIAEAEAYASPERRAAAADQAAADVQIAAAQNQGQLARSLGAMGVNPNSGRFVGTAARSAMDAALATAGARNNARREVDATGRNLRIEAINLGQGLAVNPGSSRAAATNAGQAGFQGAMSGYGQQANILNADYQNRMQAWQARQGALGGLFGALGTVAGALWPSSKDIKTDKTPVRGALRAVEKMPVEAWTYKPGRGDGGRHIGPYAEDFARETGMGDGKTIDPITMAGVTMGAIKELSAKVRRLERRIGPAAHDARGNRSQAGAAA